MTGARSSADGIPIIVVHQGWKPYLETCLRTAARCRGLGRLVLIGDSANGAIGIGEHHDLDDPSLTTGLEDFRAVYQHHSSSKTEGFERFCLERWFLVRNFMRRERLDHCLVIDSDVLLFCDVAEEAARFRDAAMTFSRWDAVRLVPHCNFVGCRGAIESFCDYVMNVYRISEQLEAVKAKNGKKFSRHWVSDMSLFHEWSSRGEFPIGMLEHAVRDGIGYDDCIDRQGGFCLRSPMPGLLRPWKRIEYRDGVPHARHRRAGAVPMKCLHFHGAFKDLMDRHASGLTDDYRAAAIMLRRKFASLPKKGRLFAQNYIFNRNAGPAPRRAA